MNTSFAWLAIILLTFYINTGRATTIEEFSFEELIDISELIIEGRVVDSVTKGHDGLVYTTVTLRIEDVIKGFHNGEFIELKFLGGEIDGKTVSVSGLTIPEKNERGIYFIESTEGDMVNPIAGWSQGRYEIVTDENNNEVLSRRADSKLYELESSKEKALKEKLKGMKFGKSVVERKLKGPETPQELKEAVAAYLRDKK